MRTVVTPPAHGELLLQVRGTNSVSPGTAVVRASSRFVGGDRLVQIVMPGQLAMLEDGGGSAESPHRGRLVRNEQQRAPLAPLRQRLPAPRDRTVVYSGRFGCRFFSSP